ncbi:DNA-binding response regulator [Pseudoalteromonas citrea]|uniref:DNA-binding response regulator n=1 Tax=Pseudoalteromonas citrea TaxID=43655 RepID=A0A5S3XLW2_9GAMM|nr:response regulator transcription factor [Pseudoalteromonas citrea]TMP39926.1 DNA-binding response regulator [Pseudoalteromonas citrea]TMP55728.1 DNA-binding response regulator [Pseudoalteromonas citrea]
MIVLLVEDDALLAAQTIDFLNAEGIEVDYASSLAQARGISLDVNYDAMILDINLPDGTGLELATTLQQSNTAPILFLTARTELEDKLHAFSLGALDYITKPFALEELAVRIKLLGQKQPSTSNHIFKLDSLSVDITAKIAKRDNRILILSPQQWCLLTLLIQHSPNPVTKDTIIATVWPEQDVNNNMYKSLITRLRSNISHNNDSELLHTLKKHGLALKEQPYE